MLKKTIIKLPLTSLIIVLFLSISCKEDIKSKANIPNSAKKKTVQTFKEPKIEKVTFYIENSASIFGYVHGSTDYINVLTELAYKNQFIKEKTPREFNFINGGTELKITPIGNDPIDLTNKLNRNGFNCGDVTKSNLNSMFQIALNKAKGDSISILISDGIYDVNSPEPINAIVNLGQATKAKFIDRLSDDDIQTIMIKMISDFNGDYYYISKKGNVKIKQKRPYYIWIFGESRLLNKYFPEEYISNKLSGYDAMIRFLKIGKSEIPYQATTYNKEGDFKFSSNDKNILKDVTADRNKKDFGFSVAVDFSSLPFSDSYLNSMSNYDINDNFEISKIEEYDENKKKIYGLGFKPTHIITVHTNKSPFGVLRVSLKNTIPNWIDNTNIDNDGNIKKDTSHTIGFKYLTKGITDAYQEFTTDKGLITTFKIELKK